MYEEHDVVVCEAGLPFGLLAANEQFDAGIDRIHQRVDGDVFGVGREGKEGKVRQTSSHRKSMKVSCSFLSTVHAEPQTCKIQFTVFPMDD